jgi:hypothetical protein
MNCSTRRATLTDPATRKLVAEFVKGFAEQYWQVGRASRNCELPPPLTPLLKGEGDTGCVAKSHSDFDIRLR